MIVGLGILNIATSIRSDCRFCRTGVISWFPKHGGFQERRHVTVWAAWDSPDIIWINAFNLAAVQNERMYWKLIALFAAGDVLTGHKDEGRPRRVAAGLALVPHMEFDPNAYPSGVRGSMSSPNVSQPFSPLPLTATSVLNGLSQLFH